MINERFLYLKRIYILLALGGFIFLVSSAIQVRLGILTWNAWWVSNGFHILGGIYAFFLVRALFIYAIDSSHLDIPRWFKLSIFIGGALVLGVFWEWYEFIIEIYSVWFLGKEPMLTYMDTMGDLLFDTLGALLACLYVRTEK